MVDAGCPDWDIIIEKHSERVFRTALRILGSVQDAEDVSQDVFVEAFRQHGQTPVRSWVGFLVRLTTLRSIDRLRQKRPAVELREFDKMSVVEPSDEAAANELAAWLRRSLLEFSDQQAAIFVMIHFEGLSRDEVAPKPEYFTPGNIDCVVQGAATFVSAIGCLRNRRRIMTPESNVPDSDQLESPLRDAVAAALAEALPRDAIERVKARAKQIPSDPPGFSGDNDRVMVNHDRGWKLSRRFAGSLAVAATLMIAVAGILLLSNSGGQVFAQVIQNVNAATSLRVDMISRLGRSPENRGRLYVAGNRLRLEAFDGRLVSILDTGAERVLTLNSEDKIAQLTDLDDEVAKRFTNPIDELRRAKSADAKDIGEEFLDGHRTRVYRLSKVDLLGIRGKAEMIVWVDAVSELPAKIVIRNPDPKNRMEVRLENFEWQPKLGDELFSMRAPNGFKQGIVVKSPPPRQQERDGKPTRSTFAQNGVLSRDRVPSRIVWNSDQSVTALLREPESVPSHQQGSHELRRWNLSTGQLQWTESVRGAGCLAITTDGKWLATVIGDEIQLRDATTGKVSRAWDAKSNLIALAFSPDGKTLVGGVGQWDRGGSSESGGVRFWDVQQGTLIRSTAKEDFVTRFVTYSSDGMYVAAASNRSTKLFDASTGELVRVIPGRSRVAFSPDAKTIACVGTSADKKAATVELYQVADGTLIKTLSNPVGKTDSWLLSVNYSPDGKFVAAADWNQTVTVWHVASGQRHPVVGHSGGVHTAVFAPDSSRLATGGEDRLLRIQQVPTN